MPTNSRPLIDVLEDYDTLDLVTKNAKNLNIGQIGTNINISGKINVSGTMNLENISVNNASCNNVSTNTLFIIKLQGCG